MPRLLRGLSRGIELTGRAARADTLLSICTLVVGCAPGGPAPVNVTWNDSEVLLLVKAMGKVDRTSLGFTPIPRSGRVLLEGPHPSMGSIMEYDAMLHI